MLSIKHFVCCGMDVHKKFVVAAIALTDYRGEIGRASCRERV